MVEWISAQHLRVIVELEPVAVPNWLQRAINAYWQAQKPSHPKWYRGPVLTVAAIRRQADMVEVRCRRTDYAHFWFGRNLTARDRFAVHPIFAAACPVTADGYLLFAQMAEVTARPGRIQAIGGVTQSDEIEGANLAVVSAALREMAEEIGIQSWELPNTPRWVGATLDGDGSMALAVRVDLPWSWSALEPRIAQFLESQSQAELAAVVALPWGAAGVAALESADSLVMRHVGALLMADPLRP